MVNSSFKLWHRYVLALCLIACTAIGIFSVSRWAGTTAEAYSSVINIAGRQRMLSQRIAYLSLKINDDEAGDRPTSSFNSRSALKDAVDLFERSHNGLTNGAKGLKLSRDMTSELKSFYFAPTSTDRKGSA